MAPGLYGKHPAKGDFIEAGLPLALRERLEYWLDTVLAEVREGLGPEWPEVWARAPMLRFWLGEAIWGEPVAGVMQPAQDRVGRRFPLLLLASGPDAPQPPVTDAAQHWHDQGAAFLADCLMRKDFATAAELLPDAPAAQGGEVVDAPEFWATRVGPGVAALWADVAMADHRRAAARRSYWWVEGEHEAAIAAPPPPAPDTAATTPPAEPEPWQLPLPPESVDVPDSPFGDSGPALTIFAPPEPAQDDPDAVMDVAVAAPAAPPVPRQSQLWAGEGLPPAAVLAWFFKGHVGNV